MGAPLTQTQLPLESILDINGKQTYLGNAFSLPAAGTSLANTSETPLIVIKNPAGSGRSIFIFSRSYSSNLNPVIFRTYLTPIINVAGSTTSALNMRTGATQTSISTCYEGATISSNGTLFDANSASPSLVLITPIIVIDQGSTILITGQQAASGTSTAIAQLGWYEI